ncbi:MAG: MFS transporter, partial [Hyphomicrobium sp.]
AGYIWYALATPAPLIDLRLLQIPTFRAGVIGGFLFRLGLGAGPFLLPLLFQYGFGMTPFQSGMMTFATGVGAMFMKTQAATILRRWGYRRVLVVNALISSLFTAIPALYTSATPTLLITGLFLIGGLSRSLQFTSINTLAYADVPPEKLSRATSFAAVGQELSGSVGVTVAALGLEFMQRLNGGDQIDPAHFPPVFLLIAAIAACSAILFWHLPKDAGRALLGTPRDTVTKAAEPDLAEPM